jgi:hypothetical protein
MRSATVLCVVLLLGLCSAAVLADKYEPGEKSWSYGPYIPRAIIPEQEPLNNDCPGQPMACGDVVDDAQIQPAGDLDWFYFDVPVAGMWLTIGTDVPTMGGSCDTYLELYDTCGGPILAQDDDSGPGLYSLITNYVATHAGTYIVKCRGYSTSTTGNYKMFLTCTEPVPPPPNDLCSGAIPIERCTVGSLNGDLTLAHNDYDPGVGTPPPSCTGYPAAGKDVTYLLNLQAGDICHFVYTANAYDASFYLVTDCSNVNDSCVRGADAGYDVETISWTCTATGTYYLICDAYGTDTGGTFTLTYEITCPTPEYVCCVGHDCYLLTEAECAEMQGIWHPEWDDCGPPNPCDIYTPADKSTWGKIKDTYRRR